MWPERRQRVADHQQFAVEVDRTGARRLVDRLHERPVRFLDEFAEGAGENTRGERELLGPYRGVQLADGDGAAVLVPGAVGHDACKGWGAGGVVSVPGVIVGAMAGGDVAVLARDVVPRRGDGIRYAGWGRLSVAGNTYRRMCVLSIW